MGNRYFPNSLIRSVGLHFILLMFAFLYLTQFSKPFSLPEQIEISLKEPQPESEKQKPLDQTEDHPKTVVQRSEGEIAEVAKKDSYLSEKTKVVKQEKSAKNSGEALLVPVSPKQTTSTENTRPDKAVKLSDLGVKIETKPAREFKQQRDWAVPQTGEMIRGGQYVQGLKEGEVSALNTKEFVFFSYFDRVRKQLDQAWQPMIRENIRNIYKSGRKLASNADYVTRTTVVLNQKGEIVKVQIMEESGTHDLDQAAIDALNKAGPYPNPPHGLIDSTGLVQIRWDFILKT